MVSPNSFFQTITCYFSFFNLMIPKKLLFWVGDFNPEKQNILIHAAGSGVGTSAIQLAKAVSKKEIFATAGTDSKEMLKIVKVRRFSFIEMLSCNNCYFLFKFFTTS